MKKLSSILLSGVFAVVAFGAPKPETPISNKLRKLWSDPVLQEKINIGIEHNRKGDFYLNFVNARNRPVKVENLKIEMLSHDFLFGAQIFLLDGFKTEQENRQYEKEFVNLFNFATVPFYWKNYEHENGKYAFGKDCEHDYRRPSQDAVVEFCNKNGLKLKGHTLSWYINKLFLPTWLERDEKVIEKYLNRYMGKIAERYSEDITIWDVSNESSDTRRWLNNTFPKDHTFRAFKEAERLFPYSNELIINHTTPVWFRVSKYEEHAQDYLSTLSLIERGAKVDVIGLQLHFFKKADRDELYNGNQWTPDEQYLVLDTFARLNRPIHITELSFPCMNEGEVGEEKQAFILENFYKLWFSHPKVEAITYWHFVDGTAGVEDVFNSGFIRRDFTKKKSYHILENLIKKQWRTDLSFDGASAKRHFRCFYGKYKVSFTVNGKQIEKIIPMTKTVLKNIYVNVEE